MDYVSSIGCPDILLSRGEGEEWILCPVSREAKTWAEEAFPFENERSIVVRGFSYLVELFDSLTDSGLSVR